MNLNDALAAWLKYRARMVALRLVASSTFNNQSTIVHAIQNCAIASEELEDVRKSDIELWMGERLQTCQPVTVRGEMNVLRQVLNWCVDEGHLLQKPRFPMLSVPNVEKPLPSDEAFQWVLRANRGVVADALEFMMLTGLSPHELERLQTCDGTLNATCAEIRIGMRPDFPVKQPSRKRIVPLNRRAASIWLVWTTGTTGDHHPFLRTAAMQKAMRRTVLDGWAPDGADQITPKMMRKWFASKVAGEQPEQVLQRLLGHAPGSPITRRHYVRSTDGQVQQAVEGLKA